MIGSLLLNHIFSEKSFGTEFIFLEKKTTNPLISKKKTFQVPRYGEAFCSGNKI